MSIPLPIVTERLLIRAFVPGADASSMVPVYGDPEVMRFIPGGAIGDEAAIRNLLEKYACAQAERGFSSWAVVERATESVVGDVGFGIFEETGEIEVGYTLARACWGRGFASEAARAALEAGLLHLDVTRIIAVVDVDNEPSLSVAERIGMTRNGAIEAHGRPHIVFTAGAGCSCNRHA